MASKKKAAEPKKIADAIAKAESEAIARTPELFGESAQALFAHRIHFRRVSKKGNEKDSTHVNVSSEGQFAQVTLTKGDVAYKLLKAAILKDQDIELHYESMTPYNESDNL